MHGGVISGRWPQYMDVVWITHGLTPVRYGMMIQLIGDRQKKSVVHRG